jgi:SAM-dependent methyltransferase
MAKRSKDAALDYLAELGIQPAKNMQEVRAKLVAALGEDQAKALWRLLHGQKAGSVELEGLYALTRESLARSLTLADAMDGDLLRKLCHWLDYHKKLLGKTILEVGCGCGIVTCFLAKSLPTAQVVGVERQPELVEQARELAARLGLTNVTFRVGDVAQLEGEQFDTILTGRTLRENVGGLRLNEMQLMNTQATATAAAAEPFAGALAGRLAPGGRLLSFEQLGRTPQLLGWLYALGNQGLVPVERYQKELLCQAAHRDKVPLSVTVAEQGTAPSRAELFARFARPYEGLEKGGKYVMMGDEANLYLQLRLGQLIEGYQVYFPTGEAASRMALWTDKEDPNTIINEQQAMGSKSQLFLSLPEKQEAEIQSMRGDVHNYLRRGMVVRALTYENGVEGETDLPEGVN